MDKNRSKIEINFKAGNSVFSDAAGSPFYVYAISPYEQQQWRTWNYAVRAGFEEKDEWKLTAFANGEYHLRVYGPNGFYREFTGNKNEPLINIDCDYEMANDNSKKLTGNISLVIINNESKPVTIEVKDNSYKAGAQKKSIPPNATIIIVLNQLKTYGWYDFSVMVDGNSTFEKRFAGHVETGAISKTDPFMGRVI